MGIQPQIAEELVKIVDCLIKIKKETKINKEKPSNELLNSRKRTRFFFLNQFSIEKTEIRVEVSIEEIFSEILLEVAKKFGITTGQIVVANNLGESIPQNDWNKNASKIKKIYGERFYLFIRGDVGLI